MIGLICEQDLASANLGWCDWDVSSRVTDLPMITIAWCALLSTDSSLAGLSTPHGDRRLHRRANHSSSYHIDYLKAYLHLILFTRTAQQCNWQLLKLLQVFKRTSPPQKSWKQLQNASKSLPRAIISDSVSNQTGIGYVISARGFLIAWRQFWL